MQSKATKEDEIVFRNARNTIYCCSLAASSGKVLILVRSHPILHQISQAITMHLQYMYDQISPHRVTLES